MPPGDAIGSETTTRALVEELAARLDVSMGKVKLELIFVDGRLEDGWRHERLDAADLACSCRRHAWSPGCPRHGRSEPARL
jgi:hypothetical protein